MNKKIWLASTIGLSIAAAFATRPAIAGTFVNGGFEDGDFSSWEQGSGYWSGDLNNLTPVNYSSGSSLYDASADASAVS